MNSRCLYTFTSNLCHKITISNKYPKRKKTHRKWVRGSVFVNEGSVQTSVNIIQSRAPLVLLVYCAGSLLPEQVQHGGLQVVSKGTDSRHQPVRTKAGIGVHHTLCDVHLQRQRGHRVIQVPQNSPYNPSSLFKWTTLILHLLIFRETAVPQPQPTSVLILN